MSDSNGGNRLDQRLIPVSEIAKRFNRSEYTIMQWCRSGVLPAIKLGRDWLIPEDRLADWIEAGGTKTKTR